ncbi:Chaperone NapD [Burkholderiales bacterium]|nr:Chaperone NapD [Burkholderiales bacterium]
MNISSLVVHAKPTQCALVRAGLAEIPGVEIHASSDAGKFVVTLEAESDGATAQIFDRIYLMDGVMSAAMVYHQFEPDPEQPVATPADTAPVRQGDPK